MAKKPKPTPNVGKSHVQSVQSSSHQSEFDLTPEHEGSIWRQYLRATGPGLVTGASDDDPSGIATYSQAGAQFGSGLPLGRLVTFPLMAAVQEICDPTALATGTGRANWLSDVFTGRVERSLAYPSSSSSSRMHSTSPPTWSPLARACNFSTQVPPGSGRSARARR